MVHQHQRPMGAPSDVSELEYLSALVQSESADIPLRTDGTISPIDVRRLLMSRHGLRIPVHRIKNELFQQLAGSTDVNKIINDDDDNADDLNRRYTEESGSIWVSTDDKNRIENSNTISGHASAEHKSGLLSSIEITTATATNIVRSLTRSTTGEDPHNLCLDLVQITALLIIPELQRFRCDSSSITQGTNPISSRSEEVSKRNFMMRGKSQRKDDTHIPENDWGLVIDAALRILLAFSGIEMEKPESNKNIELTTSVIREILVALEEDDDVSDELLQEMLYVAATGKIVPLTSSDNDEGRSDKLLVELPSEAVMLNRETFINALTADVAVAMNENVLPYENCPTTHYEDAIRTIPYENTSNENSFQEIRQVEEESKKDVVQADEENKDNDCNKRSGGWLASVTKTTQITVHTIHESTKIVANDKTLNDSDLHRIWTAPSIDFAADTYKSFWWTVTLWFTLVILFFSYFVSSNLYSVNSRLPSIDCTTAERVTPFACKCMKGVVIWLNIFVQLAVLGTTFILLSSFGNTIYRYSSKLIAVLMCLLGILVTVFTTILAYRYTVNTILFSTEKDNGKIGGRYVYAASLVLGCILLLIQLANLLRMFVSSNSLSVLSRLPIFAASARKLERNTKCAASFKLRRMIKNALTCHANHDVRILSDGSLQVDSGDSIEKMEEKQRKAPISIDSINSEIKKSVSNVMAHDWHGSLSDALYNYEVQNHKTNDTTSIAVLPIWRELWYTHQIGNMDGIWINPRLVASNLAQWLVLILIPFICIFGVTFAEKNSDYLATYKIKVWEVKVGISVGALFSLVSIFYLAAVYIPSAVATVMGFRCGVIGSLKDKQFAVHRYALDQTTILYGAAFWGALFTCAILWALTGAIAFIVVWKEARNLVQTILATIIGFLITLLLKLLILQILRKSWYGAFYRRKPAAANIMNIMLECWSLGLSSGYVIARIVKLILVAIFYIGRIDTPFLAPGVGWLFNRVPIDAFPIAFRKDLLSHEAHRHPYIERLSMLFLLKLHNGSKFGCRACAVWRILFVRALMPWLRKYRKRAVLLDSSCDVPDLSTGRKSRHGFLELASTRKKRALEMENDELRRENVALRQQLLRQTRLVRRKSALTLPVVSRKSVVSNGSDGDVFYDTTNE